MIKIVNKKRYNTETAESIAVESKYAVNDFSYWREELFLTASGNYFIYGDGGAASRFSKSDGGTHYGSSDIIPVSVGNAYRWLERYGFHEEIERLFPGEVEDA